MASSSLTIRWNKLVLEAIKQTSMTPPLAARALAMVHTAIYDAWSIYDVRAISTTTARYIKKYHDCKEEDVERTICYAAYNVCSHLFWLKLSDSHRNIFRDLLNDLGYDPDDYSIDTKSPQGIGNLVARLVISHRQGDGSNEQGILYHIAPYGDYTNYVPGNPPVPEPVRNINLWQPQKEKDNLTQQFLTAHWALVLSFAWPNTEQYCTTAPYNSRENPVEFRLQAEEVYHQSQSLTDLQKAIAEYWMDGEGTITNPGHWCEIAQYIADTNCRDYAEADTVKLFFTITNALLDATIACWESKRRYNSVRPVTSIREYLKKRNWKPFLPTPPSPEHVSLHATCSRAASIVLRNYTGSDEFGAAGVLEKATSVIEPGRPFEDIQLPVWKTFTDAALEAGLSGFYGGIHFKKAIEDGFKMGEETGNNVWERVQFYLNYK